MGETSGEAAEFTGVKGSVRTLLRLEGLAVFLASMVGYAWTGLPWWLFVLLFLAPDLCFLTYFLGTRAMAIAYDATHTFVGPLAVIAAGVFLGLGWLTGVGLIWTAHIGIDRAIGYGLRYPGSFQHTHLGPVGTPL
jgi:Domain of unknown function (DUF4260)